MSARKQKTSEAKNDFYNASTLENLRHGVIRYLKAPPCNRGFDIINAKELHAANGPL